MKRKMKVLLSLLGISTFALASVGCSTADGIKQDLNQLFCKHEYSEFVETKAPTCTEKGEQERTCDKCGKVDKEDIEMIEHVEYTIVGRNATCDEDGYTDGVGCMNCDTILDGKTVIPAKGHTYVDKVCVDCGTHKRTDLMAIKSVGEYENTLVEQENGLYSYTFLSKADYVRSDVTTLEKGDTLVAEFTITTESIDENGWFGVVFGDGTDVEVFPSSLFGMAFYTNGAYYCIDGQVVEITGSGLDRTIVTNGLPVNYRVELTRNEDDTYSYTLSHNAVGEFEVVSQYLNFECPTPTSLYLSTYHDPSISTQGNTFTLTDLSFYKLG